jgi:hypothetical protein
MTPKRIKELRHHILRAQVFPLQLQECLEEIEHLQATNQDLEDHMNSFCKCPTHGPSLVEFPEGEFDE